MFPGSYIRTCFTIIFRPSLFAGVYFQNPEILVYVCGLKQGADEIVNRQPNVEMDPEVVACRYSAQPVTGGCYCARETGLYG